SARHDGGRRLVALAPHQQSEADDAEGDGYGRTESDARANLSGVRCRARTIGARGGSSREEGGGSAARETAGGGGRRACTRCCSVRHRCAPEATVAPRKATETAIEVQLAFALGAVRGRVARTHREDDVAGRGLAETDRAMSGRGPALRLHPRERCSLRRP